MCKLFLGSMNCIDETSVGSGRSDSYVFTVQEVQGYGMFVNLCKYKIKQILTCDVEQNSHIILILNGEV